MSTLLAVVGDVHGAHHALVRLLSGWERARELKLDFVLQVGDFEPHRDEADLATMAAPAKYRKLGDFGRYSRGESHFPWPIFFIGGNHEPYGLLDLWPEGGEIAPNCFYFGRAGEREIGGLRVAGLSAIFAEESFTARRPGVDEFGSRSNKCYACYNQNDIARLLEMEPVDVLLLHEWPTMPSRRVDRPLANNGAQWIEIVVKHLQPKRIFCGHAHTRWSGKTNVSNGSIPVECLSHIERRRDCFAVYEIDDAGNWREIA